MSDPPHSRPQVSSQSYVCKAIIEAPRSAERRHGLREIVVGESLDSVADIERLWDKMYHQTNRYGRRGAAVHTISGVDLALWDLLGKHLNQPVYELLGGLKRPRIRVYMSVLFEDTPEETAALATEARELGFTAVKFGDHTACEHLVSLRAALLTPIAGQGGVRSALTRTRTSRTSPRRGGPSATTSTSAWTRAASGTRPPR